MKMLATSTGTQSTAAITNPSEGEKKSINPELWQACAGPLVNLPAAGTHVVYFPQGHSEQVAASMKKDIDAQIPNYPNLPSKLLCLLHNITLHADPETDEVYAQMTLQPVPSFDREALLRSDLAIKVNKPQTDFFCKTLTASDTSTHGGFSVPRRAADKIFPLLDFTMQPPAQELKARDLHDIEWNFRHIYRGQPKRHLLTSGWSLFVSGKRLFAGDSVLFIRDEKQKLLLGIRRAHRQPTNLSSSVLSSDSMHIGILAAAAHAAANNSPFTVFYNPRASPSEFIIPLAKYYQAVCNCQISLGMRFRMLFETEESGTRRYMGTITGISDLDPVRWKNSQWRNLQVGWDESTAGEKHNRISVWEIEPVTAPLFICPTPFFRSKRPRQLGMPDDESSDLHNLFKRTMPWLGDDLCVKDPQALPGLSLAQWMNMQQNPSLGNTMNSNYLNSLSGSMLHNLSGTDHSGQLGFSVQQIPQQINSQYNAQRPNQLAQQLDQPPKLPAAPLNNTLGSIIPAQRLFSEINQQLKQNSIDHTLSTSQVQNQLLHSQNLVQTQNILQQQQQSIQNHQLHRNMDLLTQQQQQKQQQLTSHGQQQNLMTTQMPDQVSKPLQMSENQIQLQLLQKLHQGQQILLAQQSMLQQPSQLTQLQEQQKKLLDMSQGFSKSVTANQIPEMPQTTATSLPQTLIIPQQMTRTNSLTNVRFSQSPRQQKLQQQPSLISELSSHMGQIPTPTSNQFSTAGSSLLTGTVAVGHSVITDDGPSCSTSPSTNNCHNLLSSNMTSKNHHSSAIVDEMTQSSATLLSSNGLETMSANVNMAKDLQRKTDSKPSLNISKSQNQGFCAPQTYSNWLQIDYLDSSSSATSVCLSQNDVHMQQNTSPMSLNPQPMLFRSTYQDFELQGDLRKSVPFRPNMDSQLGVPMMPDAFIGKGTMGSGKDISNNLSAGSDMLSSYDHTQEAQQVLSSSMVSQAFGVPDMTFNSIDSTINNGNFLNRGAWAPPPQLPRMRTYTKVYKRGAVGRSIDMTRYSGYEELKQDLARRFGIEGQLEDRNRVGWKLVYVDHDSDVLLVGDDPWEEFVNCVRCIKILSPQEVQQMSLDMENLGIASFQTKPTAALMVKMHK